MLFQKCPNIEQVRNVVMDHLSLSTTTASHYKTDRVIPIPKDLKYEGDYIDSFEYSQFAISQLNKQKFIAHIKDVRDRSFNITVLWTELSS